MNLIDFFRGGEAISPRRNKQREIFMYLLFGGLTTVVNIVVYKLLQVLLDGKRVDIVLFSYRVDVLIVLKVTVAWIAAVTFAFLTNRTWVFLSKGPFFREMFHFFSARIASLLLFETLLFYIMLFAFERISGIQKEVLFIDLKVITFDWEFLIKIINSVIAVVPANYFFSKWFVFRKKKALPESSESAGPEDFGEDGTDER